MFASNHTRLCIKRLRLASSSAGWTLHVGVMRSLIESKVRLSADWKQRLRQDRTLMMKACLAKALAQTDMALVRQR